MTPAARGWPSLLSPPGEALLADPLGGGVTRFSERALAEAERSHFYLIEGGTRDLLVDGGWGLATSLHGLQGRLKPISAVATHSHFDHIGLLHLVTERLGHKAEAHVFDQPGALATQALPWLDGRPVLTDGAVIDVRTFRQHPCPLTGHVDDGDVIDMGGRTLEVLHTPGHSPGSICLLDRTHGLLFSADTLHDGDILDALPGSDRAALRRSHARIAALDFERVIPGHGAVLDREMALDCISRHWRKVAA
ncbi:MAG: MBL fold metallo-hydrolase [Rhizobiaceae bacterium]|nr:MBL fold metallo-hydrolase [Rhizobiaceae bacterium]